MYELPNDPQQKITDAAIQKTIGSQNNFSFDCTRCGNCCKGPGEVYFSKSDLEKIFIYLKLENKKDQSLLKKKLVQSSRNGYFVHSAGTACHFLNEKNKCSIYPVRPIQCRTFPFWPSTFSSPQNLEQTQVDCPGTMNHKPKKTVYTSRQIARKVNATHKKFIKNQIDAEQYFGL